ncbi:hypothetical protein CJ030_MR7G000895 [Morella rubra]|uniref:Uncharacterized protein n=1 Tax=Morella rubra TaxID=262757 RepID=A0A6A1V0J5_9ROSI|nr:hypothetical protein CJ030_MR7G000895 [Morella rubra]
MGDKKESKPPEEERKIPVFTVLKNGAILKNIFMPYDPSPLASPLSISLHPQISSPDATLIATPKNHLKVMPMINKSKAGSMIFRFLVHLIFCSRPKPRCVNPPQHQQIPPPNPLKPPLSKSFPSWTCRQPGERVELKEGDMVRMGSSSTVYRLQWVPLSRAYDLEQPFVPPALMVEILFESSWFSAENTKAQSPNPFLECSNSLLSEEVLEVIGKKEIPSAPPLPDSIKCLQQKTISWTALYRMIKNDGRLVLLSDDFTLKIKAMAEGLVSETAHEFRESLVNPFSERFLWSESSSKGLHDLI